MTPASRLAGVDIGGHTAFDIAFGITRRNEIEAVLGQPRRTYPVLDDQGGEVSVYHRKPDKMHAAVSFIPVIGDLADVVEIACDLQDWRELVVEYGASGVVKYAGLRKIE